MTTDLEHDYAQAEEEAARQETAERVEEAARAEAGLHPLKPSDALYNQILGELQASYPLEDGQWAYEEVAVIVGTLRRTISCKAPVDVQHLRDRLRVCVREHGLDPRQQVKGIAERLAIFARGVVVGRTCYD